MKQGQDISAEFPGIVIIHQKIRGKIVDTHDHAEHELFIPLQGEIQIQGASGTLKAGPGKMIYLPPGFEHSFTAASSSEGERLILLVSSKAWAKNRGKKHKPATIAASQLCKELLFHLLIHPKSRAAKSLIETLLQTLSEMLEESGTPPSGEVAHLGTKATDARVRAAMKEIQGSFAEKFSISKLAKGAGMSVRNLNRQFLLELGMTPKQAITLHRVARAKELLGSGKHSVTDTAFEVGYQSVSQFITTFRKLTGQLPSEFLVR